MDSVGSGLEGLGILGVVRGHWGIENHVFRTLGMERHEEQAWCTKGAATDVLGLLRLWAYNLIGLLKGRYLRAARSHTVTPGALWRGLSGSVRGARSDCALR